MSEIKNKNIDKIVDKTVNKVFEIIVDGLVKVGVKI